MLFNSIEYLIFLPTSFLLYWVVFERLIRGSKRQIRLQNAFVVLASYVFYGWWDWRFLLLIAFTSLCSWASGLLIGRAKTKRGSKVWMWFNIVLNLGVLAVFKYYDFFVTEFAQLFHISTNGLLLKVILPVGISFYTFQALSYSIDVYRGKIEPTRDVVAFFAFISFFPQLVAGPIERATNLLPQFLKRREFDFDTAIDGLRQILWGLFKKMVVADNCAVYADQVFSNYTNHTGSTLLLAAIFFTFQIYGDFSGYSDIAIGTAKLFGIRLMRNFNLPYFSHGVTEFWRRWHISLMTWFRDYVYIPMGGSRVSKAKVVGNTFVVFLLSGLWHGANWTFVAWGGYHALLMVLEKLLGINNRNRSTVDSLLWSLSTFVVVMIGWILFRSASLADAWGYLCGVFNPSLFTVPFLFVGTRKCVLLVLLMLALEWLTRNKEHALQYPASLPLWLVWLFDALVLLAILQFGSDGHLFIYFQF